MEARRGRWRRARWCVGACGPRAGPRSLHRGALRKSDHVALKMASESDSNASGRSGSVSNEEWYLPRGAEPEGAGDQAQAQDQEEAPPASRCG